LSGVTGDEDIDAKGTATKTADEMADPTFVAELNGSGDEIFKVPEGGGLPGLSWEGTTTSTVDPSALSAAITDATVAKTGISESADGTDIDPAIQWVTPEVMQTFNAAITSAQATFDGAPTQPQVDAAVMRLSDAIAAFEAAKAPGTFVLEPPPPPPPPPPTPPTDESWKRLSGDNRYDTMAAIVSEAFSASDTDAVIVATGENFPDALAASGLAGIADAPVVLTEGGALSEQAQSTIEALEPTTVYIAGGTGSVSAAVEESLKALVDDPTQVIRSAGSDRYSTALDIYAKGKEAGTWGTTAIIASGDNYADARSVSPYSFAEKAPIFLADPTAGLDAATIATLSAALEAGEITHIIIAGGPGSVPDVIKVQLGYTVGNFTTFTRLYGASRYDTSVAVANFAASNSEALGFHQIAAATGENFPDALAGGAFAGRVGTVLLLVSDDATGRVGIDSVVGANAAAIGFGHVLGGVGTVSPALQTALETASSQT
jgi:putative cell wall-binding protein